MMPTQKTLFNLLRRGILPTFWILTFLLGGCSSPETRIATLLDDARERADAGELSEAIRLLEEGGQTYPDSIAILELKAQLYERVPDYVMAAMTYDRLAGLDPQQRHRALDAARQFAAAGETASALRSLEGFLANQPENPEAWVLKGRYLARAQRQEEAAGAYLRAVRLMEGQIDGVLGVEVGNTFLALEQYVQAERFYRDALDAGDVAEVDAMMGLLATAYEQEQWQEASEWLQKIDAVDPDVVNNSFLADVRPQLERWEANRVGAADVVIDVAAVEPLPADPDDAEPEPLEVIEIGPAVEGSSGSGSEVAGGEPNSDTAAETEALGSQDPETVTDVDSTDGNGQTGKLAALNDPVVTSGDEPIDPAATAVAGGSGIVETSAAAQDALPDAGGGGKLAAAGLEPEGSDLAAVGDGSGGAAAEPVVEVVDVEPTAFDLAIDLAESGRHEEAIREYLKILAENVDQPAVWNRLSRSYRAIRAWSDAEATALEAMRLEPRNIVYTFDYLKAVENSRSPERFLEELERAYTRIPNSPDLVLALARAYVEIDGNARNAVVYYRLFLEMAPNHPEAFSAEQELAVLRVR